MDILNFTYNTWILLGLFAASLNSIGISYKVGYSVAIALRYIPDIQRIITASARHSRHEAWSWE